MMNPKNLTNHVVATYRKLRLVLAVLGLLLPVVLSVGGALSRAHLPLQTSMSAYYHASEFSTTLDTVESRSHPGEGVMRNAFVGILICVGALFFVYQGFTRKEDIALDLAGIFAIGVALFPMSWGPYEGLHLIRLPSGEHLLSAHGACAVLFFLCIAYVAIWRSGDTLHLIEDALARESYRKRYHLLGIAMVACPLSAWMLNSFVWNDWIVFWLETAGVLTFTFYWWLKSRELTLTRADEKAALGQLNLQ